MSILERIQFSVESFLSLPLRWHSVTSLASSPCCRDQLQELGRPLEESKCLFDMIAWLWMCLKASWRLRFQEELWIFLVVSVWGRRDSLYPCLGAPEFFKLLIVLSVYPRQLTSPVCCKTAVGVVKPCHQLVTVAADQKGPKCENSF